MAQPFRRAWDILKQGPYDHRMPDEDRDPIYPPPMVPPYEPQEKPYGKRGWPPTPGIPRPLPGHLPNNPFLPNPYEQPPQERPPSDPNENPYDRIHPLPGVDPNDPYNPGPYDHTEPHPYDSSSRIAEIQTQIQRLEAELQRLLQMQSGGGGHPWER